MPSLWPTTRKRKTAAGAGAVRTRRRRGTSLRGLWRRVVGPPRATRTTRTRTRTTYGKPGLLSRAARVLSCTRRPRAY